MKQSIRMEEELQSSEREENPLSCDRNLGCFSVGRNHRITELQGLGGT